MQVVEKSSEGLSRVIAVAANTFRETVAKMGIAQTLTEQMQRDLQAFYDRAVLDGGDTTALLVQTVLNFVNKLLLQPLYDREEWMRGQALFTGEIDWTYNGIELALDYGIPSANIFATRTGNNAYGGSTSTFWADWTAAQTLLRRNVRAVIGDSTTVNTIINNVSNSVEVVSQTSSTFRLRRS